MGPKKKKAEKGNEQDDLLFKIDGMNIADLTKEQLEDYAKKLREEKDRADEERNYFQVERDQITQFWHVTMNKLDEMKRRLRSIEIEIEDDEDDHQQEIKLYKQKLKHILFEHEENIARLRAMGAVALKLAREEHGKNVDFLKNENKSLKSDKKELELCEIDIRKDMQLDFDKRNTELRIEYQRKLNEQLIKYRSETEDIRKELSLQRRTEIFEVDERKNKHIQQLMRNHEKAFKDVKTYYNEITQNNLSLIGNLKLEVEALKKKEESLEQHVNELTNENKRLSEPLRKTTLELDELKKQLASFHLDRQSLRRAKNKVKDQEKELTRLYLEEETQRQAHDQMKIERDDIMNCFQRALEEIQQKSNLKNLILEKKLDQLTEKLEVKDAQFDEVLKSTNLDERSILMLNQKIEEVLGTKNFAIKNLRYDVARVAKSHNDLIRTYTAHLRHLGVPADNLGFVPLDPRSIKGQTLGKGVAGLVSQPNIEK